MNTASLERLYCIYHTNLGVLLEVLADHPKVAELRGLVEKGRFGPWQPSRLQWERSSAQADQEKMTEWPNK